MSLVRSLNASLTYVVLLADRQTERQTDRQTKTFILLSHVHDVQGITY